MGLFKPPKAPQPQAPLLDQPSEDEAEELIRMKEMRQKASSYEQTQQGQVTGSTLLGGKQRTGQ